MAVGWYGNKKERGGEKGNEKTEGKREETGDGGRYTDRRNVGPREAETARPEGNPHQRGAEDEVTVRRNAIEAGELLCGSLTSWSMDWFLGRTYHKATRLKLDEMDDGSCSATIFTSNGEMAGSVCCE